MGKELIAQLQSADGPDRALIESVALALGWGKSEPRWQRLSELLAVEAWDQAALTLVPDGWRYGFEQAGQFDQVQLAEAWCWPWESAFDPDWQSGQQGYRDATDGFVGCAKTPALAICIAAHRALEQKI